jgi:sulfate transport system permease protein
VADVAVAAPRRLVLPRLTAGLGPGVSLIYLSVMVGLPVAALVVKAANGSFWSSITAPEARSALELTVGIALLAAIIDVVTGVALAWVLVRDDFPGKSVVNAVIDLPFALPTIVAGLVLLTLYGPTSPVGVNIALTRFAVLLAVLFVTLPFVTRAVQPVLLSLERDVEDAAACLGATPLTTFRRITMPAILPAALTGGALAFARALGEFGAVTLISGNLPFHTQVASVYISSQVENGQNGGAAAMSVTLLALALLVLVLTSMLTRRWTARRG